jgi:hypothetical protein
MILAFWDSLYVVGITAATGQLPQYPNIVGFFVRVFIQDFFWDSIIWMMIDNIDVGGDDG